MSGHDRYLELGALAAIGQISADEDRELSEHLRECHECRDAYSDYSAILHKHLPNASPVQFRLKKDFAPTSPANELRERFLARARSQGAEFSSEVEAYRQKSRIPIRHLGPGRLVWTMATAATLAAMTLVSVTSRHAIESRAAQVAALLGRNEVLSAEMVEAKARPPRTVIFRQPDEQAERALRAEIQALTQQLRKSAERANLAEDRLLELQSENASVVGERQQAQADIRKLQDQLAQEKDVSASMVAALVEAQDKIKSLNNTISEKSELLAMEEQLKSARSEVRELMGARNLHIIDVHDVSASGKSAKSFGRVFYSEGHSLVFYAFDLPAKATPTKYVFRAWGQAEANEHSVHVLGTFSVDDHEQRRWVLKVDDPKLLTGVDSVFVTAEAPVASGAPKGDRLLYAYLAGQANHP
jgi:hypothetical protein